MSEKSSASLASTKYELTETAKIKKANKDEKTTIPVFLDLGTFLVIATGKNLSLTWTFGVF